MRLKDINQKKESKKAYRLRWVMGACFAMFLLSFFFLLVFGKTFNYCEHALEIRDLEFAGTVAEKIYQPWNHGEYGLEISIQDKTKKYLRLKSDRNTKDGKSELWQVASVGDSIRKNSGGFDVDIQTEGLRWVRVKLRYDLLGCE